MSNATETYYNEIVRFFFFINHDEADSIDKAASLMVQEIKDDRIINVIGPGGHSNIGAWEMFYRAGGLRCINAILDPGTALEPGALRSTIIERTLGYGTAVLTAYEVNEGVLIIINAYGLNTMTIEVALEARKRGVKTIGVTSRKFSESVPADHPARHPSKQNLCDVVDVHIDTHMPVMDATVPIDGLLAPVGPTSTILNAFCLNMLVVRTVELSMDQGIEPPVNISANVAFSPEMTEYSRRMMEKYKHRLYHY